MDPLLINRHPIYDLLFTFSKPAWYNKNITGRLAQLVRAPPLQGGGRWFESNTAHLENFSVARSSFFMLKFENRGKLENLDLPGLSN